MTYFKKNIKGASNWEVRCIFKELLSIPKESLATIQWNSDDSLYGVSYLDESVINPSDNGYIWHYEKAGELLAEIKAQL